MLKLFGLTTALLLLCGPVHFQANQKPATGSLLEPESKKVTMLIQLTGTDSTNLKHEFLRCDHWPDWQQIWRKHRESKSPVLINQMLKFDLKSHMILAIFQGHCGYHRDVFFHDIDEF